MLKLWHVQRSVYFPIAAAISFIHSETHINAKFIFRAANLNTDLREILNEGNLTLKLLAWEQAKWTLKGRNLKCRPIQIRRIKKSTLAYC
jgi:hypothetical protein